MRKTRRNLTIDTPQASVTEFTQVSRDATIMDLMNDIYNTFGQYECIRQTETGTEVLREKLMLS